MPDNDTTNAEIPYGYCHCGCGRKTPIATKTRKYRTHIQMAGEPKWAFPGHRGQKPLLERFWSQVDKPDSDNACWTWTGSKNPGNYGMMSFKGTSQLTHRVSWQIHHGEIPDQLHVLHTCDNPSCVNPKHLFLGTDQDNVTDMINKGRNNQPSGINNAHHKLTEDDVRAIRLKHATAKVTYAELGREFGIAYQTVSGIVNGRSWKHVPDDTNGLDTSIRDSSVSVSRGYADRWHGRKTRNTDAK